MKKYLTIIFILPCFFVQLLAQKPLSNPQGSWALLSDYSDEFNATTGLDLTKWDNNVNDWSVWSWEPENVWLDGNGAMHIRMINEEHVRNGTTYYYKSGCARQRKTITYGYFEAKVKGCPRFPGVCPAFWMYSQKQSKDGITYNEIDFMEVQQREFNIKGIDCNLHYVLSGSSAWYDMKNFYNAPFAPNDGYHVYGCNVTPTEITFYIDGIQVASNVNQYFILPMTVTLSMGVRPPLMKYGTGGERLVVVPDANLTGFPTEMLVDYVRVWQNDVTAINDVQNKDVSVKLSVYPNPCVDISKINYVVAENGNVKLSVFDLRGRKIKELINQLMPAGSYSTEINTSDIGQNGVYLCELETTNKVTTTKLLIAR